MQVRSMFNPNLTTDTEKYVIVGKALDRHADGIIFISNFCGGEIFAMFAVNMFYREY